MLVERRRRYTNVLCMLGNEPRTLAWKAAVLNTTLVPSPPPPILKACVSISYQIKIESYLFKIVFCEQYKHQPKDILPICSFKKSTIL